MTPKSNGPVIDRVDAGRHAAADRIDDAASTVRGHSYGDGRIREIAGRTAEYMSAASDYMRTHDVTDMRHDLENLARRHPTQFVVGALVFGMLVGRAVSGRKDV